MEKLIKELEQDILDCSLDAGDGGDNTDMISCALETLEKLKALVNERTQLNKYSQAQLNKIK